MSATKSQIGHPQGASGAAGLGSFMLHAYTKFLRQSIWAIPILNVVVFGLGAVVTPLCRTHSVNPMAQKNVASKDADTSVLFEKHCDTRYGKDGQAKTLKAKFTHARNLTDPKWQAEVTDERLFSRLPNGKGKTPAWGRKLSEVKSMRFWPTSES